MDCVKCGAPLPPRTDICAYCGAVNDTDLRTIQAAFAKGPASDRLCPRCNEVMGTIDLRVGGKLLVERCDRCLGIFFDPKELESLLDVSVKKTLIEVDRERMNQLIEEHGRLGAAPINYIKCPVCQELMNRHNFGARSGVVVDVCKAHGIWLDGGELGRLVKWARAGGLNYADERRKDEARKEELEKKREKALRQAIEQRRANPHVPYGGYSQADPLLQVLRGVASLFF